MIQTKVTQIKDIKTGKVINFSLSKEMRSSNKTTIL